MAETPDTEEADDDGLFAKLKTWCMEDFDKSSKWREEAKKDFAYVAGDQWDEKDKEKLRDQMRPIITMNRIDPIIDSVSGSEVANRQEVRYLPREEGDVQVNEVLTSAAQWFRDQCDAEDEESDAFRDTLIGGMGWTETRLDYEEEPDGEPKVERLDPMEMVWDCTARKRNLVDARRLFHIRKMSLDDAKALVQTDYEDADYNAAWVEGQKDDDSPNIDRDNYSGNDNTNKPEGFDKRVTLVRAQWWEREPIFRVAITDVMGQSSIKIMSEAEHSDYQAKAKIAGVTPKSVKGYKKVFKQAYLGARVLESGDAPCKGHFSFNCITGKRDRNENAWYGLVRGMRDPQNWANKFFSQMLHIINTTAKGGIIAERGAFDDDKKAEETWARQDAITWARAGMVQKAAVQPKPNTGIPPGLAQLMEFAISSIRDVSGVNVETLGMAQAQSQAASLDMQRKQAAMTILQPMFDSLRRYRKVQGRVMLYLIQNYLSDGRLIRIVGNDQAKYAKLSKDTMKANVEYDIIVDDAPSSPNQKEATWGMLQQILPVIGKMIPAKTYVALLEYSPLPTSAQEKIKKSLEPPTDENGNPLPPPPDPEMEKAKMQMQIEQEKAQMQMAIAQQDMQIKREQAQLDYDVAVKKAQADMEVERIRASQKLMVEQQIGQQQIAMGQQQMAIKSSQAEQQMQIAAQKAAQQPPNDARN